MAVKADKLLTLTCRRCEHPNPRPLPYNMMEPDKCDSCSSAFRTWFDVMSLDFQMWRRQSKIASAVEAVANTVLGLVIAFAAQWLICWFYNIPLSNEDNAIIVGWMTGISVIRSYAVRRWWDSEFWKRWQHG